MDYRQLFADARNRPRAYGLDGTYGQYVAFITGCDAGNEWGLLVGFSEWLAIKGENSSANVSWSAQILMACGHSPSGEIVGDSANQRVVESLFGNLDAFLSERRGAQGIAALIARYVKHADG